METRDTENTESFKSRRLSCNGMKINQQWFLKCENMVVFQFLAVHGMPRIPWTAHTNASILSQLKIKTRLSTICLQRILSYFGHITRRGNESIDKLIVVGNVEGKETGARTFYNAIEMAKDRTRWREIFYDKFTRHSSDHDSTKHDPTKERENPPLVSRG
ncbi:jg16253 [Pararge aegeria aegeria]|uniref:Jg16253 protein n=1 Tax=Pararge aegeria aegeria TaxID=348720 RepID=A0A8S4RWF5_9NEOP|nr:jg16253 [Pararge aegeria aegeria]